MKQQILSPTIINVTNNIKNIIEYYPNVQERNNVLEDKMMFFIKVTNEPNIHTSSARFISAVEYINQIADLLDKPDVKKQLEIFVNKKLKFEKDNNIKLNTKRYSINKSIQPKDTTNTKNDKSSKHINLNNLSIR